jgi:hypothetical protein
MKKSIHGGWHSSRGYGEYRVKITMSGYGSDEDAAEDLLEGYLQTHPDVGPVISLNSAEDTIAVTMALDAPSQQRALELAADIWAAGGEASGIRPGEVIRAEVERVSDEEAAEVRSYAYA